MLLQYESLSWILQLQRTRPWSRGHQDGGFESHGRRVTEVDAVNDHEVMLNEKECVHVKWKKKQCNCITNSKHSRVVMTCRNGDCIYESHINAWGKMISRERNKVTSIQGAHAVSRPPKAWVLHAAQCISVVVLTVFAFVDQSRCRIPNHVKTSKVRTDHSSS